MVLDIYDADTKKKFESATSFYKDDFIYKIGEVVKTDYDQNINKVCSAGIHYYLSEDAAYWHEKHFFNGKWVGYYDNGQLKYERMFKYGKREGKRVEYHKNGQLKEEGILKDGKRDGKWVWYYENGKLEYEIWYKDGKREGKWV